MIQLAAARRFVQLHGRLLDRRRLAHLLDGADPALVQSAVAAYANPDGGFAGLLEPDVRTLASQPIAALTGLEVLHEVGAAAPPALLDWLTTVTNGDGGIPFHLPAPDAAPQAPWMRPDPGSSLHMTAAVAAAALRVGAAGPWVEAARRYCYAVLDAAPRLTAHETKYVLDLCDAGGDTARLASLGRALPRDGRLAVEGGTSGETLGLLALAPEPGRPVRRLFDERAVDRELDQLEQSQQPDGGWDFDWLAWAPVAAVEWRARLTVDALVTLHRHERLAPAG